MTALIGLRSYLFRYRAYIIGGLVFIILANAIALIHPYLIRLAVDSLHIGLDPQVLLRYGLLIVLAGLLQAVAARRIEYELRGDLFKHFEKLEIDYFQHNKQGDLVDCPSPGAKVLFALLTSVALPLAIMGPDVAQSFLASCGTYRIRAKLL